MEEDPQKEEIRALKAALRESRWQHYHLFTVQRQRGFFAQQREKDLLKDLKARIQSEQKAGKLFAEIRHGLDRFMKSPLGLLGRKHVQRLEKPAREALDWENEVPRTIPDASSLERPEDEDEALKVPFLTPTVDIVMCIHNALNDVQACLKSVEERSPRVQNLILVNDGSDEKTSAWLETFATETIIPTEIIRNLEARGYTIAANQGMRRSHADYVILLNSDTIVTHHWIETLLACGESDPEIGILGPLSNAASWQSVPERYSPEGDWEVNELPQGITPDDVASRLLLEHEPQWPEVTLINGFCYVIKRQVFNRIGYFDEETFPRGYGEENDFSLRAGKAGFKLTVADNGYVFHAKSKSFTHEKRRVLSKNATQLLHDKHGQGALDAACVVLRDDPALARAREVFSELQNQPVPFRVLFLMDFKGEGGGTHSIVQECGGLCELGIFAQMAVRQDHLAFYRERYPGLPESRFHAYQSDHELTAYAGTFEVVVATLFTSVDLLKRVRACYPAVLPAYYIQDYEPLFYAESDPLHRRARESYSLIPDMLRFAKTAWLQDTLKEKEGVEVEKVTPSIDHSVYTPAEEPPETLTVSAMIRPSTPRRAPDLTARILSQLKEAWGEKLKVIVFGCPEGDEFWKDYPKVKDFEQRGILTREGVADVLRNSTVFLDLSTYQAFGRTGLEAMACGCVPVLPQGGGTEEYAADGENCRTVDTSDENAILETVIALLKDAEKLRQMRRAALETAGRFTVEAAARSEKELFQRCLEARS